MKVSFQVVPMVFVVFAGLAACSGVPVASEKQTSDQLETAALNEQTSSREILIPANSSNIAGAKTAQEMEKREEGLPPKHLKQQRGHRRQHKTNRHHGKHHHYRHRHQTLLTRHSVPNRSASDPGQHYARAYKANNSRQIKTAKIVQPTGTDSTTSEQVTRSSAVPTQTTTGAPTTLDDPCAVWENCALNRDANVSRWLEELPNCPCQFHPMRLLYNSTLYDHELDKYFEWRVMKVEKLSILRRTAEFCIRQRRSFLSSSFAAQVCCYNSKLKLITRGVGAGTPFLVSPDWSSEAHYKLDELPIRLCNGDWTRYHAVRPPNNGRNCTENPDDQEFARQVAKARDY